MKIVLIDDEPAIIRALAYFLEINGYEVVCLESPALCPAYSTDSCDCVQEVPCGDIVLVDNHMPLMSGLEFIRRQHLRGCKGVVKSKAVMSGSWLEEERTRAEEIGCAIFDKPVDLDRLLSWVREQERDSAGG